MSATSNGQIITSSQKAWCVQKVNKKSKTMAAVKCLPTGAKVVTCEFLRRICEEEERRTELN